MHVCALMCKNVCPRLILLPLFPLRISCIIYGPLMNMLISRRAERGERASPVLFLHLCDERGGKKERDGKEREEDGIGGEAKKECVASVEGRK